MPGHKDMGTETCRHMHMADVDTGPNQSHTDIGTDKGFETWTHRNVDTDVDKNRPPGSCPSQMERVLIFVPPLKISPTILPRNVICGCVLTTVRDYKHLEGRNCLVLGTQNRPDIESALGECMNE